MSERLYSLLLRLYPRAFRERYAEEMRRVFIERRRDEGAVRAWIDVLVDAAVSIPRQHFQAGRSHPTSDLPPASAGLMWTLHRGNSQMRFVTVLTFLGFAGSYSVPTEWRAPVFWLCGGIALYGRAVQRANAIKAYHVEICGDAVTVACEDIDLAPVTLHFRDVIGVDVSEKVGLRLRTTDPARDVWVPSSAPAYEELRDRLSERVPVTIPSRHLTLRAR